MSGEQKDPTEGGQKPTEKAAAPRRTPIAAPQATREFTVGDGKVGQDMPRDISTTGELEITPPEPEPVFAMPSDDKLENLRFMEEYMEIRVEPSADKFAESTIPVGNGHLMQLFVRGRVQRVKRKYVECLCRAKTTNFTENVFIDRETGDAIQRMNPMTALRYPFTVIRDTPAGRDWLQKTIAEA